jgi:hypothetical protein
MTIKSDQFKLTRDFDRAWVHRFQNNQGWGFLASAVLPAAVGVLLLGVFLTRRK